MALCLSHEVRTGKIDRGPALKGPSGSSRTGREEPQGPYGQPPERTGLRRSYL
jgi:hypothetical protein